MASVTLDAGGRWSNGVTVSAYLAQQQIQQGVEPSGTAVTSAVVTGGAVTFTGVTAKVPHVAWYGGVDVRFMAVEDIDLDLNPTLGLRKRVDRISERLSVSEGTFPAEFADTFEPMKIIGLANQTVKAIPASADAPAEPTGLGTTARLSSVRVAWSAAARAARYVLYRSPGGILSEQIVALSYRDLAIDVGSTYQYWVQAVDQYGQRSAVVGAVSAFIDPALNVAPTVEVRAWPATAPTDGRTFLRVNASDANGHALELALGVSAGTIEATDDPSVWIYTP